MEKRKDDIYKTKNPGVELLKEWLTDWTLTS